MIEVFNGEKPVCAIGSVMPNIGHTGAAASLASLVKTSLCLYQEIIPPLTNYAIPASSLWKNSSFHIPAFPQYWSRDKKDGPRRACVGSMTIDGNCMHAVLEGIERDIRRRDENDSTRDVAPLKPAADAVIIDSTIMTALEVVDSMLASIRSSGSR